MGTSCSIQVVRRRNGVGILVDEKLREQVVEVNRVNDRVMAIKLVIGGFTTHVCNAYKPQVGLVEEGKRSFWEVLDEVIRGMPSSKKLFLGGDFNRHIEYLPIGYDDIHSGFSFGDRNNEGTSLLDFAKAFGLVVVNSSFSKKEEHLVNFHNRIAKTQIDFLLLRKEDRALYKDCKVFLNENLATQYRLLMIDLVIKIGKKRRGGEGRPRVK
ncbi:uncharacterized protein LOC107869046 [Capsicum annuum]|uniref:uncharacterized protein LOC107869046 n=1 Tax=Capsicum annuum TaxID=4072 RepID=UPI0007BF52D9|nr:uncharacterized protein LOC107869046 [Capsicum annuum]